MRLPIVSAIVAKDLRELSRDRFWAVITIVGLAFMVAMFWVIPADVDETVSLGVHQPGGAGLVGRVASLGTGFEVVEHRSAASLRRAVADGDVAVGLELPADFARAVRSGERPPVTVLVSTDAPGLGASVRGFTQELAAALAGEPTPVALPDADTVVVGPSGVTAPPSFRDRVRPLFAFMVLLVETFALAALVAGELAHGTARAVVVTPARVADLLAAKTLVGVLLAFAQGVLLLALTGTLALDPPLLALTMLLGAVLVTGVGLLAGSAGGDFMTTVFISIALMFPLMIPAFGTLFPGTAAWWVELLPSAGLVDVITGVALRGEGWSAAGGDLLALTGWCVALIAAGWFALQRRLVAR